METALAANAKNSSSNDQEDQAIDNNSNSSRTQLFKRLTSDSYKAAMTTSDFNYGELSIDNNVSSSTVNSGGSNRNSAAALIMMQQQQQPASPSSFKSSFSPKSAAQTTPTAHLQHHIHHLHHYNNLQQQQQTASSDNYQFNLLYKRQEANYYVQQILTDLLALGVLEYESGFDNAINRTYKVNLFVDLTHFNI